MAALMGAMGPGSEGLPAADGRRLAERVSAFLTALPPGTRRQIRLAFAALEWISFPRRLSRLDPARRAALLSRMETSRFFLHRDLLMLAKLFFNLTYSEEAEVREAIGVEMSCRVSPEETEPLPTPVRAESPAEEELECEVLVIGSGAGGATAAARLAGAGLDVIVLEAGGQHRHDHNREEVMPSLSRLYRDGGLTLARGRPMLPIPVGRTLGGTTVINSGTCFRAPEATLERWAAESGITWAPELDPVYAEAERMLHVTRLGADVMGNNGRLAMLGAERLGISGRPLDRNAGACVQCSGCPLGCPIHAKRSMLVSYLPKAAAAGARIFAGVEAERLLLEGDACVGALCRVRAPEEAHRRGAPSRPLRVRAGTVVVAAGALGTPELLLGSAISGPALGRNLRVHPATWVGARYPESVRGWEGVMQSYYIDRWKQQGLFLEATFTPLPFGGAWLPGAGRDFQQALLGYDHVASIGVHLTDHESRGRLRLAGDGSARISYKLSRGEAARLAYGIARAAEVHFAAGAIEVYPNIAGLPRIGRDEIDRIDPDRIRGPELRLEAFHPMGTARIDADPGRGVCSPEGRVHGRQRLYVADASLFPSSLGVNPMMTVIAFADRIAERLAHELS